MLSRLIFAFLLLFVLNSCVKKKPTIENQITKIVDSISKDKKNLDKLFIVQHQKKWNKDFIKISTAEYFSKDSISNYASFNGGLIIYYSDYFVNNKEKKLEINQYNNFIYKEGTISIFHPINIIMEIDADGIIKMNISEKERSQLFQYGNIFIPEPKPTQ